MLQWVLVERTGKVWTPVLFLQTIFVPLAGFFNTLVYLRPRYLRFRHENADMSFRNVISSAFHSIRRREAFWRPSETSVAMTNDATQERFNDTESTCDLESGSKSGDNQSMEQEDKTNANFSSELEDALETDWADYLD